MVLYEIDVFPWTIPCPATVAEADAWIELTGFYHVIIVQETWALEQMGIGSEPVILSLSPDECPEHISNIDY